MISRRLWQRFILHLDPVLMAELGLLMLISLIVLYSASGGNWGRVEYEALPQAPTNHFPPLRHLPKAGVWAPCPINSNPALFVQSGLQ